MPDFEKLISLAKKNDETAMLEIINAFKPLINKKFKESYYNEDVKSELTLKLIQIVKQDIKFDKMREINNYILIKYIEKSISNHYIWFMKEENSKQMAESSQENETAIDFNDYNNNLFKNDDIYNFMTIDLLKSLLTKREFECVYYNVFMGFTPKEISKYLNISNQACNQCKLRAFKKIRKYFES